MLFYYNNNNNNNINININNNLNFDFDFRTCFEFRFINRWKLFRYGNVLQINGKITTILEGPHRCQTL